MSPPLHTLGAAEITRAIRDGSLSSTEVVEACIARIEAVDGLVNAFTVRRFDEARAEAAEADAARERGEELGPLHGLPITVKDQFKLAGTAVTLGLERRKDHIDLEDGPLIRRLRAAGAIVLGKTNVLQMLMGWECENPVWGRTNNPWDLARTPGGSSGGEAAAVASGMSPLGIGGDFGGSIRVPASFCGVAGLKPTAHRLTVVDTPGEDFAPQEAVVPQLGPIARNVEDLRLALSVLCAPGQEAFDATVPPVPWSDGSELDLSALTVGWVEEDGLLPTAAGTVEAIRRAVSLLERAGAKVVEVEPVPGADVLALFLRLLGGDRMAALKEALKGEPSTHPAIQGNLALAATPTWVKPLVAAGMRMWGQPRIARLMDLDLPTDTKSYFDVLADRRELSMDWTARMDRAGADVVLTPVTAVPAFLHGSSADLLDAMSHNVLVNVLGLPAGTLPVRTMTAADQGGRPEGTDPTERAANLNVASCAGLPGCVHVVGRPWREDQVLATMAALEAEARREPDYPATPVDPRS